MHVFQDCDKTFRKGLVLRHLAVRVLKLKEGKKTNPQRQETITSATLASRTSKKKKKIQLQSIASWDIVNSLFDVRMKTSGLVFVFLVSTVIQVVFSLKCTPPTEAILWDPNPEKLVHSVVWGYHNTTFVSMTREINASNPALERRALLVVLFLFDFYFFC